MGEPRSKKFLEIFLSIFTTTLELTLSKIREKNNCPPRKSGAGQKRNKKTGSRAKNFLP